MRSEGSQPHDFARTYIRSGADRSVPLRTIGVARSYECQSPLASAGLPGARRTGFRLVMISAVVAAAVMPTMPEIDRQVDLPSCPTIRRVSGDLLALCRRDGRQSKNPEQTNQGTQNSDFHISLLPRDNEKARALSGPPDDLLGSIRKPVVEVPARR